MRIRVGAGTFEVTYHQKCTGRGEMAMRLCTAHSVVMYLKMGMTLEAAGREAIAHLGYLVDPYFGRVSLIAMDARGNHGAFSNGPDATYVYMTDGMPTYAEVPRIHVPAGDAGRRL